MATSDPTAQVLRWFEPLTRIPRPSGGEERVAAWLESWAAERDLATRRDAIGNLVIIAPGSPGQEQAPAVVLKGHMDMVCERTPDSEVDPATEPLVLRREGDWLCADRTTLGADNGIAIAMALAILSDPETVHPPLELLFTVDEETGLTGATELDPSMLTGRTLLNIDSETEGVLTVGCAGGRQTDITLALTWEAATGSLHRLRVHGLRGGHSGVDIHEPRVSANKTLAMVLRDLDGVRAASLEGGTAHNAIPRDAEAMVCVADPAAVRARLATLQAELLAEHGEDEPGLRLSLEIVERPVGVLMTPASQQSLVALLSELPHGVAAFSKAIAGLVETSNNMATVTADPETGHAAIVSSQRSSVRADLDALCERIEGISAALGAVAVTDEGYPGWEPNLDSPLLARCKAVHLERSGEEPVVEAIHAGLECGVLGQHCPGMDMISFGPTIQYPHSPEERLHLPSVGRTYLFLVDLLAALAS